MTGAAAALAARLRRRAFARILPALGPQWVLVVAGDAPAIGVAARAPRVVVAAADSAPRGSVRGSLDALPVLSGAATGVLVVVADGASAARAASEAARLLQPGGVAAFVATWTAESVAQFDAVVTAAGLDPARRFAIRRVDGEPSSLSSAFPWIEERRAAASSGDQRVECAVLARSPGPDAAPLPTSGTLFAEMFLPRRAWRRRM